MRAKDAHNYTLSATSSTVWVTQAVNLYATTLQEDLPTQIIFNNAGTVAVVVKAMDKDEGDATTRDGVVIAAGGAIGFEVENREKPFYKVSVKLLSGAVAATVYISCLNYKTQNV